MTMFSLLLLSLSPGRGCLSCKICEDTLWRNYHSCALSSFKKQLSVTVSVELVDTGELFYCDFFILIIITKYCRLADLSKSKFNCNFSYFFALKRNVSRGGDLMTEILTERIWFWNVNTINNQCKKSFVFFPPPLDYEWRHKCSLELVATVPSCYLCSLMTF